MMTYEPKCVSWKRIGAKKVAETLSGFTRDQELEFWRKQTEKLRASQVQAIKRNQKYAPNKANSADR